MALCRTSKISFTGNHLQSPDPNCYVGIWLLRSTGEQATCIISIFLRKSGVQGVVLWRQNCQQALYPEHDSYTTVLKGKKYGFYAEKITRRSERTCYTRHSVLISIVIRQMRMERTGVISTAEISGLGNLLAWGAFHNGGHMVIRYEWLYGWSWAGKCTSQKPPLPVM